MDYKLFTATLVAANMLLAGSTSATEPLAGYVPQDVKAVCQVSEKTFYDSWVKILLPTGGKGTLIGPFFDKQSGIVYVFPADGPSFNPSADGNSNCAFFEWGEQMFMWLTSTISDDAGPGKDTKLKNTSVNTPYVFSSEFFYRLEDGVLVPQSHSAPPSLKRVRSAKSDEDLESIAQAGDNGVLFTHPKTGASNATSLVYYEVLTNRPYGYVADAAINKAASPYDYSEFVDNKEQTCSAIKYGITQGFVNDDPITAYLNSLFCPSTSSSLSETKGTPTPSVSIPQLETAIDFLSMNMEVKTAWVDASTLKHPERYVTQKGLIPVYDSTSDDNELVYKSNKNADLALIGMHVVGSVKDHPEMIWATFEHVDNAPNATYYYKDEKGKVKQHTDTSDKANKWLLSDGTAVSEVTEYGVSVVDSSTGVNSIQPASDKQTAAVSTPSNVNRINPWGSVQGMASAESNTAVISTNVSALTHLQQFYKSQGLKNVKDPRLNYMLTGASWGVDGKFPTGSTVAEIAGTPAMANTTMETFQQTYLQKASKENTGCFSCHGITSKDSKFGVSHIFGDIRQVQK